MKHALVLATTNRGKIAEFRALLADLPLEIHAMSDVLDPVPTIRETGSTFAENAERKARAVARETLMLTVADDSGLEVDLLGGRPGVRSARFAHERATDAENNRALFQALESCPTNTTDLTITARFRCAVALVDPYGEPGVQIVEGVCEGALTRSPRGIGGFGYDPLFYVPELRKTMAELLPEEKHRVSHRARACEKLKPLVRAALTAREEATARVLGVRSRGVD